MIDEKGYVLEAFEENFQGYKNKKLVIYGLGKNTKVLLDEMKEYHFVGLMDGVRTGDRVWGLPVVSCQEAKQLGAEAIIILARSANVQIIYQRIARLCRELELPVFDINGEKLSARKKGRERKNKENWKKADLYKKIDECQILSVDIFDTVLMRRVLVPTDIFLIIQERIQENGCEFPFFRERQKAEKELLAEGKQPMLQEIYDRKSFWNPNYFTFQKEWMELEIRTEKEFLLAREGMKEVLKYARALGKPVFFTSDMYLTSEILAELLTSVGIQAGKEEVIVSCEYGMSKCSGLHDVLRKRFPDMKILHIGDNTEADGRCAKEAGIDEIFLVDSAYSMFGVSSAQGLLEFGDTWENRIVLGNFAARQFGNPFVFEETGGKVNIDSEYEVGYYFLAPVFVVFIRWLLQKAEEYRLDWILLSSRDGYIIKKLLDLTNEMWPVLPLPRYTYFYTSRAVCVRASIRNEEDILYASRQIPFSGTAEELLSQRFGVGEGELLPRRIDEEDSDYVMRHGEIIKRHSHEARERYQKYLSGLKIRETDRCGFFDFVSGGTCQYALDKFWCANLTGLYFLKFYDPVKAELPIDALYQEANVYTKNSAVEKNYFLLERIVTSPEPTLADFDEEGRPLFGKETRAQEELDSLEEVQRGILDGFREYGNRSLERKMADEYIRLLDEEYTVCHRAFFQTSSMVDEFCNRSFCITGF